MMLTTNLLLALASGTAVAAVQQHCPPLGPVLPAPVNPSANPAVSAALSAINTKFQSLVSKFNISAASIAATSIHEDKPLFELHYTPPSLASRGVQKVDSNSIYRIGSLSKVFTALAVLKLCKVDLDDTVTKYLPQLKDLKKEQEVNNDITTVHWDQITLGALASHMAGIGADLATDLADFPAPWTALGLPNLTTTQDAELPHCAGLFGLPPCNETDFYATFGRRPPVYAPFTNPVYSNIGFAILGLVVEAVSNQTFTDFVQTQVFDVAGMNGSSLSKPDDARGVIPVDDGWWNASLGVEGPAGGFYSTTSDLLAFGSAILTNKFLAPVKTRKWLKPVTFTSSHGFAMGAPWEILRSDSVTTDGRVVNFYTKSGDVGEYHGQLCLVPDYDFVISVLVAGSETSSDMTEIMLSQIIKELAPAFEQAGKAQAQTDFGGSYSDAASNSTLVLSLDDGPGFAVSKWIVRGVDVVANYPKYNAGGGGGGSATVTTARLYPTNLEAGNQTSWRAVFESGTLQDRDALDAQLIYPQGSCITWSSMDRSVYSYNAIDNLVFSTDDAAEGNRGQASAVELRAFQVTLQRDV
ncbi:beta-lactamase/transpeptidase-like protein [Diplogelasinospora grovesii]|uniref:Beta-lactamase/transpeptidase-like protein n=1 Tax=Diplogelasinospora grovesii TaxID=303347 RepID=A0AAN6NFM4_9PEZI|nr:beta-lactamase/transpeptidase-like protein [Diplogelasinospora grovesii]